MEIIQMNSLPFVSIAMATYNGAKYINAQIESILAQNYGNLELVISDDCSSDATWDILQSFARQDQRIRLLPRDIRRGYASNFYRVFAECRADFISPSDQDDVWHPDKTRLLMESIGDRDLIYCNSRLTYSNEPQENKAMSSITDMISGSDPRRLLFCNTISGHAMIFKKEVFHRLPSADFGCYIDWSIAFLASNGNGISYLDNILVDWRQHPASFTAATRAKKKGSKKIGVITDIKNLDAFSSYPGKEQEFILEAKRRFDVWLTSHFNLSMFFFVLRHRHITHQVHPSPLPQLKYLIGYKLKKLLRPNHY